MIQIWALDTVAYAYHGGRSLAPSHHGSLPTPCQAFEEVHRDFIPSPTTPSESVAATDSATILHRQPEKRYVRIDVLLGRMSRGATRSDPFADDAVDATMSKTCQPTVRRSRCHPRDRRVYWGRGSTVLALSRLRKRKLWPIILKPLNGFYVKPVQLFLAQKSCLRAVYPNPHPTPGLTLLTRT